MENFKEKKNLKVSFFKGIKTIFFWRNQGIKGRDWSIAKKSRK